MPHVRVRPACRTPASRAPAHRRPLMHARSFLRPFVFLAGLALVASPARADHVVWFNPVGRYTGPSTVVAGSTPEAVRIQYNGPPSVAQSGVYVIPLSLPSSVVIDSIYICYKTLTNEAPARITSVNLRTMSVPTSLVGLFTEVASHSSTTGE